MRACRELDGTTMYARSGDGETVRVEMEDGTLPLFMLAMSDFHDMYAK